MFMLLLRKTGKKARCLELRTSGKAENIVRQTTPLHHQGDEEVHS